MARDVLRVCVITPSLFNVHGKAAPCSRSELAALMESHMKLINLTPHAVTLLAEGFAVFDGKAKCYRQPDGVEPFVLAEFPSAGVARCAVEESLLGEQDVDGFDFTVPFVGVSFGELEGLPAPTGGPVYIVSALVANAARAQGRHDVVVPAHMVRDADGKILGCLAFAAE